MLETRPDIPKDAVENTGGTPAKPTSPEPQPTDSLPGPPIQLDTLQKILVSKNTGEIADADTLIKGYQRGKQYDKALSELQKTQAEFKKVQDERDALLKKAQDAEQRNLIQEQLKALGVVPSPSGKDQDTGTSWPTDEPAPLDMEKVIQTIVNETRKPISDIRERLDIPEDKTIRDIVIDVMRQQREEEAKQSQISQAVQFTNEMVGKQLKGKYGDILSDDILREIQDKQATMSVLYNEAATGFANGDNETAAQKLQDYMRLQLSMTDQIAGLDKEKARADVIAEADKTLISNRFPGGTPSPDGKVKTLDEVREEGRQRALANIKASQQKKIAMGS